MPARARHLPDVIPRIRCDFYLISSRLSTYYAVVVHAGALSEDNQRSEWVEALPQLFAKIQKKYIQFYIRSLKIPDRNGFYAEETIRTLQANKRSEVSRFPWEGESERLSRERDAMQW